MQAVELRTPRLLLRGTRVADFDAYAALWADPEVTRHIGGRPLTREEAWGRLLRSCGQWPLMGFGYWIVEDAANGALVGTVGFQEARRTMQPSIEGTPEAGWVFAPATHGKGLASEAVAAMLAWSDGALDAPETTCIIEPANTKSIALALRFGFRPDGAADYNGVTVAILRRPRGGR